MKFTSKMWIHKECKERMDKELTCSFPGCGVLEVNLGNIRNCLLCGDAYCKKHKKKCNMERSGKEGVRCEQRGFTVRRQRNSASSFEPR